MAAPFDASLMEVTAPPTPMLEGLALEGFLGSVRFAVSAAGDLLYWTAARNEYTAAWSDRSSGEVEAIADWSGGRRPSISPGGDRVAVERDGNIFVHRFDGRPGSQITSGGGVVNTAPSWSPDGQQVLFLSERASETPGLLDLFSARADGSGTPTLIHSDEEGLLEVSSSPDGEWLVYATALQGPTGSDIRGIRTGVDAEPIELAANTIPEIGPRVSPNGRYLALTQGGVVVVPFPNTRDAMVTVGERGSRNPVWSTDGRELFYLTFRPGSFTINVARIADSDPFRVLGTEVLSTHPLEPGTVLSPFFDVHPSGERFLVPLRGASSEGRIVFVQNWDEELNARLSTGR